LLATGVDVVGTAEEILVGELKRIALHLLHLLTLLIGQDAIEIRGRLAP
jgi:hypothetical protein